MLSWLSRAIANKSYRINCENGIYYHIDDQGIKECFIVTCEDGYFKIPCYKIIYEVQDESNRRIAIETMVNKKDYYLAKDEVAKMRLSAKHQGKRVTFNELLENLQNDIVTRIIIKSKGL